MDGNLAPPQSVCMEDFPSYTARDCVAGNRGIGALHPDVSTFRTPGGCESSNRLGIICDLDTKRYFKGSDMIFSSAAEHGAKCGTIYNAQSLGKSLNQADF